MTDFETYYHDELQDKIINYAVYKRMFTPYEEEQKYSDESCYEDMTHQGYIKEVIELPDNDILLGIVDCYDKEGFDDDEDYETVDYIEYFKLSEIRIWCKYDNE